MYDRSIKHKVIDDILSSQEYRQHDSAYLKNKMEFEDGIRESGKIRDLISPCLNLKINDAILYKKEGKNIDGASLDYLCSNARKTLELEEIDYTPPAYVIEKFLFKEAETLKDHIMSYIETRLNNAIKLRRESKVIEETNLNKIHSGVLESLNSEKICYVPNVAVVEIILKDCLEDRIFSFFRGDEILRNKINLALNTDGEVSSKYVKEITDYFENGAKQKLESAFPELVYPDSQPFNNALFHATQYNLVQLKGDLTFL